MPDYEQWSNNPCLLILAYACHEFTNNVKEEGRRIGVDSSGWWRHFSPERGCLEGCLWERRKSRAAKNEVSSSSFSSPSSTSLSLSPSSFPSRTVSGNCLCRWNLHARRGNKRLNFSRGTVRLFNWNQPFRDYKCTGDEM